MNGLGRHLHVRSQLLHGDGLEAFDSTAHVVDLGDGSKYAALHLHGLQGASVQLRLGGSGTVLQNETVESAVVSLAHSSGDADVCGDSGNDKVLDSFVAEDELELGVGECATARLVDDGLVVGGLQLVHDAPALLTPNKEAAKGSISANAHSRGVVARAVCFAAREGR